MGVWLQLHEIGRNRHGIIVQRYITFKIIIINSGFHWIFFQKHIYGAVFGIYSHINYIDRTSKFDF